MNKAHLALLVATLVYGLFYVAIKLLVSEIDPWETFTLRLLLVVPLFFILEKLFYNGKIQSRADLLKITGLGLLGITIVQSTIVVGLKYTSVFHAGFIVGTAPIITLILSVLMKQERLTWSKVIGVAIAFTGLVLLLSARGGQTHLPKTFLLGDMIVFANIAGWSLFLILSRPLLKRYPPFSLTSYAFITAGVLTLPVMLWLHHGVPGLGLSTSGWLWMAFVVIFCTILSYFLNYFALSRLNASTVAVYVFLQPLITAIFAHWILHEAITTQMILQGVVILIGVSIATESYIPVRQWLQAQKSANKLNS